MFVRRSAIHEIGVLDENFFFFGEQVDWCERFKEAEWAVCFSAAGNITHFGYGSGASLNYGRNLFLTSAHIRLNQKYRGFSGVLGF